MNKPWNTYSKSNAPKHTHSSMNHYNKTSRTYFPHANNCLSYDLPCWLELGTKKEEKVVKSLMIFSGITAAYQRVSESGD